MTANLLIPNATNPPLPLGEGLEVRSNLTKRQIEATMYATGVGTLEGLKDGRLIAT